MSLDVLVADQDVALAELYCRYLADHGLTAQATSNGLECLGMVRHFRPRVMVLDRELPGDGDGVLAGLRRERISLPVILTTWKASPQRARQLVVPPVAACLRKFFPLPALLGGIRGAASGLRKGDETHCNLELTHQGDSTWNAKR